MFDPSLYKKKQHTHTTFEQAYIKIYGSDKQNSATEA